jgi:hypothetical protein
MPPRNPAGVAVYFKLFTADRLPLSSIRSKKTLISSLRLVQQGERVFEQGAKCEKPVEGLGVLSILSDR